MGTIRIVLLAALVALLATPSAAESRGGGCKVKRKIVDRNAVVTVYWGPRNVDDGRALCATYRGRRPYVLSFTSLDAGPEGKPVLAGRFVFLIDRVYERGTGDSYAIPSLVDVARRRVVHQWEFYLLSADAYIEFPVIRLLRSGSVAFSVGPVQSDRQPGGRQAEIHRAMGPLQDTLAAGPDVDATSLQFSRETMHWTEAGQSFTAAFF